ncbi:hypothetical protein D6779_03660 [Candidatus Parcubacteria bacterium]|nr:MAG: hypothetical protein D6779_03660 [Candidatus Parcubacteria bacterium]
MRWLVIVALVLSGCVTAALAEPPADLHEVWMSLHPALLSNYSLNGVTYGNGRYVAVGAHGLIVTSKDGERCQRQESGIDNDLYDVVWNGRTFVAVGAHASIVVSNDGQHWKVADYGSIKKLTLTNIIWDGQRFVTGAGRLVFTSPHGLKWEAHICRSHRIAFETFGWNGKRYVAGGYKTLMYADDGGHLERWHEPNIGGLSPTYIYDLAWNGRRFVALNGGEPIMLSSQDGVSWENLDPFPDEARHPILFAIAWGDGYFIAVGTDAAIWKSPDGIKWSKVKHTGYMDEYRDVVIHDGRFLAVGDKTSFLGDLESGDRLDVWYKRHVKDVVWNGSKYLAVGDGLILSSEDGKHWQKQDAGLRRWFALTSIAWNGKRYVLATLSGPLLTSRDGVSWAKTKVYHLQSVLWTGEQFVGVGGFVMTSPDGITWTQQQIRPRRDLQDLAWNGKRFVAVGNSGSILTSLDGRKWTFRKLPDKRFHSTLHGVAWNGQRFVIVGDRGIILTSPDGKEWTVNQPPDWTRDGFAKSLSSVIWTGKLFLAQGLRTMKISSDGLTWRTR